MEPLVSVILPVYNQEKFIAETIESILNQSFRDYELLIMDDGSTDNSAQIIKEFASKDNRIQAHFNTNSGKSNSTNKLAGMATGKWFAFLDADDVMLPKRLETQVNFHIQNPGVDASSSDCNYINDNGRTFGTQRYPNLRTLEEYNVIKSNGHFITCSFTALMVSRQVFIETGGLRKKFEPCEDFEFFNRMIHEKGIVLLIIPEVLMKYRIHQSSVTVRDPFFLTNSINFVTHCMWFRRIGKTELSFDEYMALQDGDSWWKKLNNRRFNYSMIYFRGAGMAILSKKYPDFVFQIIASFVLSPNYVLRKVINQIKR